MSTGPPAQFISFEGLEGVGKSTSIRLLDEILQQHDIDCLITREPGGTPVAEQLRNIVLGHYDESLTDATELMLMFAARSQHITAVIEPALAAGRWVLCDRFTDATIAYQGYGRGESLSRIRDMAEWVHAERWPDKTLLLHAPAQVAATRLANRDGTPDRIETAGDGFFDRVWQGYQALAQAEPERFELIDTQGSIESVRQALEKRVSAWLK
ncbi:MAG: dTMP kinase [Pseudomonadota bacterium]